MYISCQLPKMGNLVIISSAYTNKTYGMVKLKGFQNLFLYVIQDVDPKIVYLKTTGETSIIILK